MVTPYERVKAAWESPDRRTQLNRGVETMAAEGVTLDELDNALGKLLDEVRAVGVDDETEEIIMGVSDRLHGWCHTSGHIKFTSLHVGQGLASLSPRSPKGEHRHEDYVGREQTLVKHFILQHYLKRFAHIIGTKWSTITYVDCFSGPWESKSDDLSDTSFAIALAELRKGRDTLARQGKTLNIRCFFLEENKRAYAQLKAYADQQTDVEVETLNAAILDSIPAIEDFVQRGGAKQSFPFIFIDPTGWSGFDLDRIQPLLRHTPGEVLINFMTEHIRRFIDDTRPEIRGSIRRCFGTDEVFARMRALYGDDFRNTSSQDVEDELFTYYASRVREVGKFDFTCPAVVLHPEIERTYFHLIYATRRRKGVEVFKDVEKKAFNFQEDVRAEAEERKEVRKTGQQSLLAALDIAQPPSHRAIGLRERYRAAALKRIEELRGERKQVSFDEIWDTAMAFPLVWDSDVKEWIAGWQKAKRVRVLNLKPNQRVPQWEEGHIIEFLK